MRQSDLRDRLMGKAKCSFRPWNGCLLVFIVACGPALAQSVEQTAYIKPLLVGSGDFFGASSALSGNTLAIGAPLEDSDGSGPGNDASKDSGAVYVFVRDGDGWSQQAYLKASNADAGDRFGEAVALSGNTLVVGARREDSTGVNPDNNSLVESGAAYIFTRDGDGLWSEQAYLKAAQPGSGDEFGYSVAIDGNTIFIAAPFEDSNGSSEQNNSATDSGAVYVFTRSGSQWSQQAYLKASNLDSNDWFGFQLAATADRLIVGAPREDSDGSTQDNNDFQSAGAAYLFERNGSVWVQRAYLKASNVDAGDEFGRAVALSGNVVLAGAPFEDSDGSGQADNSRERAGAAYVFAGDGFNWSQIAYLKAANADSGDEFGWSVALDAHLALVGAYREDGDGSEPSDNSLTRAGAAYLFAPGSDDWRQLAYIKASNPDEVDRFGQTVLIQGNRMIIGAPREDGDGSTPLDNSADDAGAVYATVLLSLFSDRFEAQPSSIVNHSQP